jgi:hypothetical protein
VLLALFLLDLAAGLVVFLPLAGRRNAGVKFYRLVLVISGALVVIATAAHALAGRSDLAITDLTLVVLSVWVLLTLRYPKRLIFRLGALLLGLDYIATAIVAFNAAMKPSHWAWAVAGALSSVALLGSVNLAMTLGHWYLVVRGMAIDPLKRLTIATLVAAIARLLVVAAAVFVADRRLLFDIFFWMRALWGLAGPLALFPMVWGTVRIRSTMAATGILYVDVVAVVIGEVLGGWLASLAHLPL